MLKSCRRLILVVTCILPVLISCLERNDMYDFASGDIRVVYAISDSSDMVFIAKADGYFKQFTVSTSYTDTGIGSFPLNGNIVAVEEDAGDIYFHTYNRSSWLSPVPEHASLGGPPSAMFLKDDKIYYSYNDVIYYFNGNSYQTINTMIIPTTIVSMAYYNGEIYMFGDNNTYRYDGDDNGTNTNSGSRLHPEQRSDSSLLPIKWYTWDIMTSSTTTGWVQERAIILHPPTFSPMQFIIQQQCLPQDTVHRLIL